MSWSNISCGFDVEEETRNFGTRAVALGEEAVFESTTLAVLESVDVGNLNDKPWSLSKTCARGGFASVLDNSLNVFSATVSELLFSFSFGSGIEELELSHDGCFLFIGLQGSCLLSLHLPTETLFKISKALDSSGVYDSKRFFAKIKCISTDTILDLIVVTTSRKIIRIYGTCIEKLVECCWSSQDSADKRNHFSNILTSLKFDVLCSPVYSNSEAVVAEGSKSCSLIVLHCNVIEWWYLADGTLDLINSAPLEDFNDIDKACVTPDERFIVCHLRCGWLLFVDMFTLEASCLWQDQHVIDFSFICFGKDTKMVSLVKNETSFHLISLFYPSYNLYFKLPNISDGSLPIGLQDCFYYLEYFGDDVVKTVKIKTIVENDPKSRLDKLLLRGKYEEAEEFCRCFNLPMVEVNKYKAKNLADDLSVWRQDRLDDDQVSHLFKALISILNDIQDIDFIVELCITSVPCKLELVEKLLQYAVTRLDKTSSQDNLRCKKVFGLMKLFKTFIELNDVDHNPNVWAKFSPTDFFKECQNYINKGDIRPAVLLCSGYWEQMSRNLTPSLGLSLLTGLPLRVSKTDLFLWLETYIPLYLSLHEDDSFVLFKKWIANTINIIACVEDDIELSHDLVVEVLRVLGKTFTDCDYIPYHMSSLTEYLADGIQILAKIIFLKCQHGVTIPFERMPQSHSKEEKTEFLFSILERVHYDDIEVLINHFISPYCSDHSLRCDEIITDYLMRLKAIGLFDDVWESRCIKFTEFIYNKSDKMKSILYILKVAPVPWSEAIASFEKTWFANAGSEYQTDISNIKKVATIQTMLLKYRLPRFEFDLLDYDMDCVIIMYIVDNISFENVQELFKDLKDLHQIFNADCTMLTAYSMVLCRSLNSGRTQEVIELLEEAVSEEELIAIYSQCIKQLIDLSVLWTCTSDYENPDVEILFARIIYKLPEKKLPLDFLSIINDLKIKYQVDITVNEMKKRNKTAILSKCVMKLITSLEASKDEIDISTAHIDEIRDLSEKLNVPFWSVYFELACQAVSLNRLDITAKCIECLAAENIDGNVPASKIYDIATRVFLCQVVGSKKHAYKHLSDLMKTTSFKGVTTLSPDFVNKMSVCDLVMGLVHRDELVKPVWYTDPMYIDEIPHQPDIPQSYVSYLINTLSDTGVGNERKINLPTETFLSDLLSQHLPRSLHSISVAVKIWAAFEDLAYNQKIIISEAEAKRVKGCIMELVSTMLLTMVHSNSFDLNLALSLLFYFSQEHALRWIDNVTFKTEQFRIHNVTLLAQTYCSLYQLSDNLNEYKQLYTISQWNKQFYQHRISFNDIFHNEMAQMNVFKSLMKLPSFNCSFLDVFCSTFSCDSQKYLLIYLSELIKTWKLEYAVKDDELIVKSKYGNLYDKCRNIIEEIEIECEDLSDFIFNSIWPKINPYYYEVFHVMITLIRDIIPNFHLSNYDMLLTFLKSYNRISTPGKMEQRMWDCYDDQLKLISELQIISKYRLPFSALPANHWDLFIAPELSLDNYKLWIKLNCWLETPLPSDFICCQTIKNLRRVTCDVEDGWDLQMKRKDLLSKITKCINRIENLEMAATILFWVVNNVIPPGADLVEAAGQCVLKVYQWKESDDNTLTRRRCLKVEELYQSILVKHILHKYNLAKPEYLELTKQPVHLFRAIYAGSTTQDLFSNPDVHDAIIFIAEKCVLMPQLTDVKKELLMNWLTINYKRTENNFEEENERSFDNLKRAIYMLKKKDNPVCVALLMNCISMLNEVDKPVQMKLRALQILMSIVPHSEVQDITGKTKDQLLKLIETFQFVYDLEHVGIFYKVYEFDEMAKDKIILNLLINPTEWRCVIAANMALAYKLTCPNIWNKILGFFLSYNLPHKLEKYLLRISMWSRLVLNMDILVNAWNSVIKSHLTKVDGSHCNEEEFTALILNCPVLDKLNVPYITQNTKYKLNSLQYYL